jgi:hypothetical protein
MMMALFEIRCLYMMANELFYYEIMCTWSWGKGVWGIKLYTKNIIIFYICIEVF